MHPGESIIPRALNQEDRNLPTSKFILSGFVISAILLSLLTVCRANCGDHLEGSTFSHPQDPAGFFMCHNGILYYLFCPDGLTFDSIANKCSDTSCTGKSDSTMFPKSGDCSGFILCEKGVSKEGKCIGNRKFDPDHGCLAKVFCTQYSE